MFEVPSMGSGTFTNRVTLEPPHYDGVQTLALRDNILFSGSRDYVIKKWDIDSREIVTVSASILLSVSMISFLSIKKCSTSVIILYRVFGSVD